jgi:hypothetical protein
MISEKNKINYLAKGPLGIKYFRKLKKKDLQGKVKHVQLKVESEKKNGDLEEKNYLVAGKFDHSELLKKSLHRLGLSYTLEEFNGEKIPSIAGDDYYLVGAGRIFSEPLEEEGVVFHHRSYHYNDLSTNFRNLQSIFNKKVAPMPLDEDWNAYFVRWKFINED